MALPGLLALAAAVALVACGGDDELQTPAATAPPTSATATGSLTAAGILPDLSSVGLTRGAPERVADPAGRDVVFVQYTGRTVSARAEVRVYPTEAAAKEDFPKQAAGWKNPPANLFGGDPGNQDNVPVTGVDEAKAYLASRADGQGVRIWTDVIRVGRVVVVAHFLGRTNEEVNPVRAALAATIARAAR